MKTPGNYQSIDIPLTWYPIINIKSEIEKKCPVKGDRVYILMCSLFQRDSLCVTFGEYRNGIEELLVDDDYGGSYYFDYVIARYDGFTIIDERVYNNLKKLKDRNKASV